MLGVVKADPEAVLGLATGSTPIGMYREMIRDHEENGTSYRNVRTVNLDEYAGLDETSDQSYVYFMRKNLFDSLDIDRKNTNIENGKAADREKECERYNALLHEMQQSVQVLGIGSNGHIAFNEPGTPFSSETHIVDLTESTIKDNSRMFASIDEVPRQAYTMGIATIMRAKCVLMVVSGKDKAEILKKSFFGPITPQVPASILQLHPNFVLIADEDALSAL